MLRTSIAFLVALLALGAPMGAHAQEVLPAGPSGGTIAAATGMQVGSLVMIGGLVFIVTATGLMLYDSGDSSSPDPTPSPSTSATGTS